MEKEKHRVKRFFLFDKSGRLHFENQKRDTCGLNALSAIKC